MLEPSRSTPPLTAPCTVTRNGRLGRAAPSPSDGTAATRPLEIGVESSESITSGAPGLENPTSIDPDPAGSAGGCFESGSEATLANHARKEPRDQILGDLVTICRRRTNIVDR